jgi:hypothetical protein
MQSDMLDDVINGRDECQQPLCAVVKPPLTSIVHLYVAVICVTSKIGVNPHFPLRCLFKLCLHDDTKTIPMSGNNFEGK